MMEAMSRSGWAKARGGVHLDLSSQNPLRKRTRRGSVANDSCFESRQANKLSAAKHGAMEVRSKNYGTNTISEVTEYNCAVPSAFPL
jgi:hypothetical protein